MLKRITTNFLKRSASRLTQGQTKILLFGWLLIMGFGGAKAQTLDPVPNYPDPMIMIRESVRNMFLPITPHVNHPILYNMGVGVIDTLYHKPILHDTLYGNADIWFRSYEQFRQATIDTSTVVPLNTIVNNVYNHPKDTIPLLVLSKTYKYFPDKVFELDSANNPFDIDTVNDALYPRNIALMQSKLKETYCFMVAPAYDNLTRSKFVFKFDPQFFFVDAQLVQEFIDKGGIRIKVTPTDSFTITNFTAIQYFAIDRTDTIVDTLVAFSAKVQKSGSNEVFGFHKTLGQISYPSLSAASLASIPFNQLGLIATKYPACESSNFKKALIYIEGIDIQDSIRGKNRDASEIYELQIYNDNLSLLRNQGYDIWVIDWKNSCISMSNNASYLVNFINFLKNVHYNDEELEPFVVIGESMGGVIARHALLIMERNAELANDYKLSHNVRTLITLDSPHKGAHIPMAFQYAYTAIRPSIYAAFGLTSIANSIVNGFGRSGANFADPVFQVSDILNMPAIKELLISHIGGNVIDGVFLETNERRDYVNTLQELGNYPKYCKLIAITNGSLKGEGQKSLLTNNTPTGNDLFNANVGIYFRILGVKVKTYGVGIHLKTNTSTIEANNPNFGFSVGVYKPKIRFQRLRMIVSSSYLPIVQLGISIPGPELCYKAGGFQRYIGKSAIDTLISRNIDECVFESDWFPITFNSQITRNDCFLRLTSGISYNYGLVGSGVEGEICSSSPNWNFIPVESALDDVNGFSSDFSTDYWSMPIQDKLDRTPFDAIMGPDFETSSGKANQNHLNIPNRRISKHFEECKDLDDGLFLNKEIGGKKMWINNWTIPYQTNLHVLKSVENKVMWFDYPYVFGEGIDRRPNWQTPLPPNLNSPNYGAYSREYQATMRNNEKLRIVHGNASIDLEPIEYVDQPSDVFHCCAISTNYAPRLPSKPITTNECNFQLTAFPNPIIGESKIRIPYNEGSEIKSVELFDTFGKCIGVQLKTDSKSYLVNPLTPLNGVYILRINTANCTFTQKLIIQ